MYPQFQYFLQAYVAVDGLDGMDVYKTHEALEIQHKLYGELCELRQAKEFEKVQAWIEEKGNRIIDVSHVDGWLHQQIKALEKA